MTTMWIADHRRTRLQSAGLATFEQVMATTAGQCKRVLNDRENWYLPGGETVHSTQLSVVSCQQSASAGAHTTLGAKYSVLSTRISAHDRRVASSAAKTHQFADDFGVSRETRPHPTSPGLYLKKHRDRSWWTRLAAFLGLMPRSPGRVEAENAITLNSLGIAVMPLTAYGEKLHADGRLESFLLSEELEGYCELQDFIERRFNVSGTRRVRATLQDLIVQIANIARRFHAAGLNHRDFYCCHFLVKETSLGTFDVRLIDLQRVQQRRWFRRRWIVKDLAQLASMSPDTHIGCREKVLFLRTYLGVKKLRPHDKRLVRAVLRKLAAMSRHTSPMRKRGEVTS